MVRIQKADMLGEGLFAISQKPILGDYVPHFHDFYEIEFVVSGKGRAIINGNEKEYLLSFLPYASWGLSSPVFNVFFFFNIDYDVTWSSFLHVSCAWG